MSSLSGAVDFRTPASSGPTRFAGWQRERAAAVLLLTAAALLWCTWVALTQETVPAHPTKTPGDAEFYRDIVGRIHAGEPYYDAVENGLRQRGYTPHSVFNWRTPVYAWLFGKPPSPLVAHALLIACVLLTLFLAYVVVSHDGGKQRAAVAVVLLLGPFEWMFFSDVVLFTELWAGTLIALSICANVRSTERSSFKGRHWVACPRLCVGMQPSETPMPTQSGGHATRTRLSFWGYLAVITGVSALFLRELALPYCLLACTLALWERRRESVLWLAGLALYGLFMAFHVMQVRHRIEHFGLVHAQGWLQWNGTAFVLLTCQINFFLLQAPAWLTALYLPLALLGLASWKGRAGATMAMTAAMYVAAFTVVGFKPHNAYWGLMYAPLLPFGLVWVPAAFRDLVRAAFRPAITIARVPVLAAVESPS